MSELILNHQAPHPGLPENSRDERANRRKRAARVSVLSNTFLIGAKLAVGLLIGSVSVLSEAVHSSVDLVAAIMALVAVRMAARPADQSHPYGHGKFENLSGTVEALLIFVGAGLIGFEAVQKIGHTGPSEVIGWGVVVMGLSASLNFWVARFLHRVGNETDSVALLADAAHIRTDVLTSLGVFAGLLLVWISGLGWLDPVIALLVVLLIIKSGWDILLQSVSGLLDASLPVAEEARISEAIERFAAQYVNYHDLRTRQAGPERHINFHLVVPNNMSVHTAHCLCDELEESLEATVNGAIVQIHIEPQSVCTEQDGVYRCSPGHTFQAYSQR